MREIKFRARDTITNIMHNSIEGLCFENGILIEVIFKKFWDGIGSCAEEIVDWQDADKTILMQYTGLKDKNGVEIYDGDIVRLPMHLSKDDPAYGGYFYEGIVKYKTNCYVVCFFDEYVDIDFSWYELEVIGNIYKNPELLE